MFFALWPDDAVRRDLGRWAGAMQRVCAGKRMLTANLHVTLAFLGRVDAGRYRAIVDAARGVRMRPFVLRLDEPGYWKHNHIAWLGVSDPPDELGTMVAELRMALGTSGIRFDPKPFVAHVTMVRNALPPKEPWPTLNAVQWAVNGFSLISSERDENGPYYRVAAGPFADWSESSSTGR